jgi:hypothetical protein
MTIKQYITMRPSQLPASLIVRRYNQQARRVLMKRIQEFTQAIKQQALMGQVCRKDKSFGRSRPYLS